MYVSKFQIPNSKFSFFVLFFRRCVRIHSSTHFGHPFFESAHTRSAVSLLYHRTAFLPHPFVYIYPRFGSFVGVILPMIFCQRPFQLFPVFSYFPMLSSKFQRHTIGYFLSLCFSVFYQWRCFKVWYSSTLWSFCLIQLVVEPHVFIWFSPTNQIYPELRWSILKANKSICWHVLLNLPIYPWNTAGT